MYGTGLQLDRKADRLMGIIPLLEENPKVSPQHKLAVQDPWGHWIQ
jgi:hypothetical protein